MKLKLTSLLILACALVMTGCTKTTSDYNSLLALLGGGEVAPAEPAAPTVTPGETQIELSWTAVENATSYEVWYNTADDTSTATEFPDDPDNTDLSCVITGLDNDITYYVWLKATNADGSSGFSAVASGMPAAVILSSWSRLIGVASAITIGNAVAVDGNGYSYTTGYTTGKIDPDRAHGIQQDVFVARYDKDGTRLWIKQMGVEGKYTDGCGIAVDAYGNSYTAGWTRANLVSGSGDSTGSQDVFVAKYGKDGTFKWVKQLGVATKITTGFAIAVDSSGNSYVTGYTNADLDGVGTGTLTGTSDVFVAKYNTDGTLLWVKQLGVAGVGAYARSIAVDPAGNCYVTGNTDGGLYGNIQAGSTDVFVLKYNTTGTIQWVKQMGVAAGLKSTYGYGIDVDASGNSYITGSTGGDLDGAGPGVLVGNPDVFVMKYNTSGVLQWLRQTSAAGKYASGKAIAIDSAGNCYAAGMTNADLDGDGVFSGDANIFVIAYDKDGTSLWSKHMGSAGDSYDLDTSGIAVSAGGTCLVAGYVSDNFDGETLIGIADAFVTTKLNE